MTKANSATIIECSTVTPFKWTVKHGYICFYCREQFPESDKLIEHTNSHDVERARQMIRAPYVRKEEMLKVDINDAKCRLCGAYVADLKILKEHLTSTHCKDFYKDVNEGLMPFKLRTDSFTCVVCDESFTSFLALSIHMNKHYTNHRCDTCYAGFVSSRHLLMHKKCHEIGEYKCPTCEKSFDTTLKRLHHIQDVHSSKYRFKCPKCPERFTNGYPRQRHLVSAHGMKPVEYFCRACDRVFLRKCHLNAHARRDHMNERNHACEKCSMQFFTEANLRNHMVKHSKDRTHACEVCKRTFARKGDVSSHMRVHTAVRNYSCGECDHTFVRHCNLKRHAMTHARQLGA